MMVMTRDRVDRLRRFLFLAAMILFLYGLGACNGNGGHPDGDDEESDPCDDCNDCQICFNDRCVADPNAGAGCGDPDGDIVDQPDGDEPPSDGDVVDGDDVEDDEPPDGDDPPWDGDEDGDIDTENIETSDIEPPPTCDDCIPGPDSLVKCPPGYYCDAHHTIEDCYVCYPGGGGDEEQCRGYLPTCLDHYDCPKGYPCNPDSYCCDDQYQVDCDEHSDCPNGMYCNSRIDGRFCDVTCYSPEDCSVEGDCCDNRGRCAPLAVCLDGDQDGDNELDLRCSACSDCDRIFGQGYYCNIDSGECEALPVGDEVDACCENEDCTNIDPGFVSYCNLHNGTCIYVPDDNDRGSIGGWIFAPLDMAEAIFKVTLHNEQSGEDQVLSELSPVSSGSFVHAEYIFSRLIEGGYSMTLEASGDFGFSMDPMPYPFNPVEVNFNDPATTTILDAHFFINAQDPRLAEICGSVNLSELNTGVDLFVEVLRQNQAGTDVELYAIGRSSFTIPTLATYCAISIPEGSYIVRTKMVDGNGALYDYYSSPVEVDLDSRAAALTIDDIDFYFGVDNDDLGSVSGAIHHADSFSPEDFSVYLYRVQNSNYPVAEGWFETDRNGQINYLISNVEAGNYNIVVEALKGEVKIEASPDQAQVDIEHAVSNDFTGRDVYFDVARGDRCSLSGSIVFDDAMDEVPFIVQGYSDAGYTNLVFTDAVIDIDTELNQASYFVDSLQPGSYYLQAVAQVEGSPVTLQDGGSPRDVSLDPGPKDISGIDFDFSQ